MVTARHAQVTKNNKNKLLPERHHADQAENCIYKQPYDEPDLFHPTIVSGIPVICKLRFTCLGLHREIPDR